MDRERQKDFLKHMSDLKLDSGQFEEQIRLFSQYMVYSNPDFAYNESYLESFGRKFLRFKKYMDLKNQIVTELSKTLLGRYTENLQLQIWIDQFWIYSHEKSELYANRMIAPELVCREKMLIKGSLQHENKTCLFLKEYKVIDGGKLLEKIDETVRDDFINWIEDMYNDASE